MAKLHELNLELLPHPPYSPDLASSEYYLFAASKRMLQGKRFGSNEEILAKTEAYFKAKDKLLYKKGIEMLEKRWNEYILSKKCRELVNKTQTIYYSSNILLPSK